ncbi:hypothetical protein GOP47_0030182 [Adiantum capillus-veneris]|nr:hypothetical protein GOP47_0030182 [Adiantum capillus-veneris]
MCPCKPLFLVTSSNQVNEESSALGFPPAGKLRRILQLHGPASSHQTSIVLLLLMMKYSLYNAARAQNDTSINIGALVDYNSTIGRLASEAIAIAVTDINRNGSLLGGRKLVVHMLDTNCSAFQGAVGAMELFKKEVVAVVGPQSTTVSHFVAHMGGATQVPLVSFAATDPALSEFQYPYFFRVSHTDAMQMQAIASFIGHYGWREVVVLYTDDDFGTNGAGALSDALEPVGARLVQKAALVPGINKTSIGNILTELAGMQTRVFVVHVSESLGLTLFSEAKYLGMMSAGYVWIVSDSIASMLGSAGLDAKVLSTFQGVIGVRGYYPPDSSQVQSFLSQWKNLSTAGNESLSLNIYGLYAYDAVWTIAYALDKCIRDGLNFTFKGPIFSFNESGSTSELAQLSILQDGPLLRTHILQTNFVGTLGLIQLNSKGDLVRSAFEIINVVGEELHVVSYWKNTTQLLASPPDTLTDGVLIDHLGSVGSEAASLQIIWPGNSSETPRGWVLPKNGRPLRIAVPKKAGFKQFVNWPAANSTNSTTAFHGFCIDVFQNALKYLPYSVPYIFVLYGQDSTPVYDDMIDQLENKVFDAVVGDVTITTKRMEKVDFTQPYTESGLVVVVPIKESHSGYAWAFLRPFNSAMWLTTLAFFVFTGLVVWMLEHKKNRDFRGHPKKQIVTVLWFTFSTLFFSQREKTKSTLGRLVILIWLFVVLIITSSYTANLTSILTVQQLTPTIQGINSLQSMNVPIGYQTGSFARDYLISLNIAQERLKPLPSIAAYAEALTLGPNGGGVAAIVDELPYVQVFLGSECGFTIAGQEFTKGGWGFAFPKDSELAVDMSTAILTLSEAGQLQKIHDAWLSTDKCASDGSEVDSSQLSLDSFWGLFLITGLASVASLLVYTIRLLCQFSRHSHHHAAAAPNSPADQTLSSRSTKFLKSFASYVDESSIRTPDTKGASTSQKKKKIENESKARNGSQSENDHGSLHIGMVESDQRS